MSGEFFEVKRERFDLLTPNQYLLQGNWPKEHEPLVLLDGRRLRAQIEPWEHTSALERFKDLDLVKGENVTISVKLPERIASYKKLTIYAVQGSKRIRWFTIRAAELAARMNRPQYFIEEEIVGPQKRCQLRGWAVDADPVAVRVFDQNKKPIPCNVQRNVRVDVEEMFKECPISDKCGFFVELEDLEGDFIYLVLRSKRGKAVYPVSLKRSVILQKKVHKYTKKAVHYYQTHGLSALFAKSVGKLEQVSKRPVVYQKWIQKHLPNPGELQRQRKTTFAIQPLISIVVPLYRTPPQYLEQMIASVQEQTYGNWELCLSDGSGEDSPIRGILKQWEQKDSRIRVLHHPQPLKIAENTNAAIEASNGEFVAFMDHDDQITPNALYECVKAINQNTQIQMLYSDEDKMSMDGHQFFQPHMKPDFNQDLLCTVNYICHLFVVRRDVLDRVGMLRPEFEGAQDYDLILRCTEAVEEARRMEWIYHIPKVLYHWRSHEDSTSENPESKRYAFEAGQRAVQAHYDRIGVKAEVFAGEYPGLYRTRFLRDRDPLISVIIPNKDHRDDLKRCLDSLTEKSSYTNLEYIIIENNSELEETFDYYWELEASDLPVKVIFWEKEFNYSAINNYGVTFAQGEYYLFLNNDTQVINSDCIEELLGYCMRPDVGAVGARMYFEDDTIQHAGVVIGFGGIAGHCFVMQPRGYSGYCHRIISAQNYSAVTAACMMVPREVFQEVEGFCEELAVAFNDIDFCMKVRRTGKLIVYNPYAELYHFESKSRGLEDTPEKVARFNQEIAIFEKRWPDILRKGDPYYNPNLTLDSQNFSLKRI